MPIRSLFKSNAATTIFLLVLPFLLLSVSSYCGDDDPDPTPDGGTSDTYPYPDAMPDATDDVYVPPNDMDTDVVPSSGVCCWGPSADEQCNDIVETVCTGTFHAGADCSSNPCAAQNLTSDPLQDLFDSISDALATFFEGHIDIKGFGLWKFAMDVYMAKDIFNIQPALACGSDTGGVQVVCVPSMMGGPKPISAGDVLMATLQMAAAIPTADSNHSYVYTLACESDGDSANDWVYVSPYDWDTYQATDRWYMLKYNHMQTRWSLEVMQVDSAQRQLEDPNSAARAVISDDTIRFFVPMDEFTNTTPACRLVTFGHDGNWSPSDRGSDCDGANPTLPLLTP